MSSQPPALPTDRVRLHVALWKIAKACGHDLALDAQQPDHILVEIVAELVSPALGKAFRDGRDACVGVLESNARLYRAYADPELRRSPNPEMTPHAITCEDAARKCKALERPT